MAGVLGTNVVAQIGIIVRDIDKTSQAFADFLGVEKPQWFWTDTIDKTHAVFRGEPCNGRAKLAFFKMANLDIELIEPDDQPSTWREFLDEHGEGVHHIAFVIQGMQEKITLLAGRDMPLLQKGEYTGGRYAYIDTVQQLKVAIELLEND